MKVEDIYKGRRPRRAVGGRVPRQTTADPDGKRQPGGKLNRLGDVNDDWLRGKSGELHPFYDRRKK
jgi:hypothetical protein